MTDNLHDRMKTYEAATAGQRLLPGLPVAARLDGRCFSRFTEGLYKPYDSRLSELMVATTWYLVRETNAACGYCQSDEITLAWHSDPPDRQIYFDGRIQKLVSVLAAQCSVFFNSRLPGYLPEKAAAIGDQEEVRPVFDCRVWVLPTLEEATNVFLWRELDATRNSINSAVAAHYPHEQLEGVGEARRHEMLHQKGVNWNDYPPAFKRGVYIQRRMVSRKWRSDELEQLPPKHEARLNPDLEVVRPSYVELNMPPLSQVTNRVAVLFSGADPEVTTQSAGADKPKQAAKVKETKEVALSKVDCRYGAPMGRLDRVAIPTAEIRVGPVRMSQDAGYDSGGAYWGIPSGGLRLYAGVGEGFQCTVWATNLPDAKYKIMLRYPQVRIRE